ncbi:6-phospho-3-hexuloisomerase [Methanoplanus endosymbiosus]|uniref:SIS domain-containing protein n=1 Tax=Methanoplanus endosymbiosus TaxID=33865 RepID=A0A9E7TIU2_9EURY|nr:6-phospho-3-hexuloisomerase [Methanoplanus endosymbiosus]UUX91184.1 SIS domain-containing protein [Methanoplanus endosymbiosus]
MTGCGDVLENMRIMEGEISMLIDKIKPENVDLFLSEMVKERRIYVAGAGRSGLIGRAYAMRLMHVGLESYVVGETVTPAMREGDAVVIFSGSGETNSVVDIAETAKSLGGYLCLITSHKNSTIGKIADCVVELQSQNPPENEWPNTFEVRQITGGYKSVSLPLASIGTLFETSAMIFSDAVISSIMEVNQCGINDVMERLNNIQ